MGIDNNTQKRIILSDTRVGSSQLAPEEAGVFARWLTLLNESKIPFLVGGAFAVHAYTGIWRDTKDLDLFLQPRDLKRALDAMNKAGFETEIKAWHWLAKVYRDPYLLDIIFGTGNGHLPVHEDWFPYSRPAEVAGVPVQLIPMEELLVSKLYVAARDRFDGADVVHLIRSAKGKMDWPRILTRLGDNGELLLWHLVLFDFVYPGHSDHLPQALAVQLFEEMRERWQSDRNPKAFRGVLLDPATFLVDIKDWGYEDLRDLHPLVDENGEAV